MCSTRRDGEPLAARSIVARSRAPLLATALSVGTSAVVPAAHAGFVGTCPADLDQDGEVSGSDLAVLLSSWGPGGGLADLTGDGQVDGADLAELLAEWGLCPTTDATRYGAVVPVLDALLETSSGTIAVPFEGQFEIRTFPLADRTDGVMGVVAHMVTMLGPSVDIPQGATGGVDILRHDEGGAGTWDPRTGEIQFPLELDAHYALIDAFVPPTESDVEGEPDDDSESPDAVELVSGQFSGTAVPTADGLSITGGIEAVFKTSVTGAFTHLRVRFDSIAFDEKVFKLPKCPEARRCNVRLVCIQPVFIGTGSDDPNATGSSYAAFKAKAETVWANACIEFEWKAPKYVNKNAYKEIEKYDKPAGRAERDALRNEVDPNGTDDCIEVYFVEQFIKENGDKHAAGDGTTVGQGRKTAKVIVADAAVDDCEPDSDGVLAHELGHALGNVGHSQNSVMKATGNSPNCPGQNLENVTQTEINKAKAAALATEKDPKEQCCASPSN